ncbi:MAG TPA: ATP-dependent DNA ligase [Candidatus Acidoferrales bacterium]|nr:ATP-dependent DNA ligase [Candidatus Acidoferrales bacterium]
MSLSISTKYAPMEAQPAEELPEGRDWHYEPKWDGFRCLAFRDGNRVTLQSKSGKPLTRYFPELVTTMLSARAKQFVLDGEIVMPVGGNLSFDDLLARIHPAASRIAKLSQETPCVFIVFDLLVDAQGKKLVQLPLRARRRALESFAREVLKDVPRVQLSPATKEISVARKWFHMGVGLDGIVAKRDDLPYQTGKRTGIQKIKKQRTADCVVGGFRYLEKKRLVGSLLLGLYDEQGKLNHVGFTSSIHADDRAALTKKVQALIRPPGFTGKSPGGLSRWSTKRSMAWEPLAPKLVVEVQFDHFTGGRFRHGTKFLHWRPEKSPRSCTMKQVKRESKSALNLL